MADTGETGGLSTAALGGIGATVVVIGGAVMVWLGVFDGQDNSLATRPVDQGHAEIAISPSANQPEVIIGVSPQQDEAKSQDAVEPTVNPSAEVVTQTDPVSAPSAGTADQKGAGEAAEVETAALAAETGSETADAVADDGATMASPGGPASITDETVTTDPGSDSPPLDANGEGAAVAQTHPTTPADTGEVEAQVTAQAADAETGESQGDVPADAKMLLEAPKLDLVRVDPTGETVIAGRAAAGIQVAILLDGEVLDHVDVQAGGEFVAFASIPPSAQARVISLRAEADGQQSLSETSFILAPAAPVPAVVTEPETSQVVALTQETGQAGPADDGTEATEAGAETTSAPVAEQETAEAAVTDTGAEQSETEAAQSDALAATAELNTEVQGAATPVVGEDAPEVVVAATDQSTDQIQPQGTEAGSQENVAEVEAEPAPQPETTQVAVLRADAEGVTLVQPIAQAPQGKVVLDTISYSDNGQVQLAGRARAGGRVLVYLDNAPTGAFATAQNGSWGGDLTGVEPGVYTLRLDEVNAEGKVLSRLETPFKREAPEVLQAPTIEGVPAAQAPLVRAVTVQKGDTLWAISQERYGSGFLYVRVFEANQQAIRDPDLIYPGQVFTIPE